MKFALNGAVTVGTLDGANIEIRERVGADNFFRFGLAADEVVDVRRNGYRPSEVYQSDPELKIAIDRIAAGDFSGGDADIFRPIVDSLLYRDTFMLFADYRSYIDVQDEVDLVYRDSERWTRMSILNTARCGYFSSDRTMREYIADIWRVKPVVPE